MSSEKHASKPTEAHEEHWFAEDRPVTTLLSGNEAAAVGAALARVEVVAAYPITPATPVSETVAELVAEGKLGCDFIRVESEHSAMATLIGASMAGARTFTGTSSQGIALMHEMLHWAAGGRCPIVLAAVNRALAAPWSILTDQSDTLSQRDTGWIQYYCASVQEVLDTVIQAFRVAEASMLPAMVCYDGFYLSHTVEEVEVPARREVDRYLPPFEPAQVLRIEDPRSFGGLANPSLFTKLRRSMQAAMETALEKAREADLAFGEHFGRSYGRIAAYRTEEAETIVVSSGTVCSTLEVVVDAMRSEGARVGSVRVRLLRPFPLEEFAETIRSARRLVVLDRNFSNGVGGIFAQEIRSHLYNRALLGEAPPLFAFVGGLGGGDFTPERLREMIERAERAERPWDGFEWLEV
jgi:pyruvate/2-oxoacid:ferredoxin oxidoreductase alpha subunit